MGTETYYNYLPNLQYLEWKISPLNGDGNTFCAAVNVSPVPRMEDKSPEWGRKLNVRTCFHIGANHRMEDKSPEWGRKRK